MVLRNTSFEKLSTSYLFSEIQRRIKTYRSAHPEKPLYNLSIGDTTSPLPATICSSLQSAATSLGTREGYTGYGPEQGNRLLREKIAKSYACPITAEEVFVSDGAKCDLARLLVLFGGGRQVVVQNPTYPAFVDSCILMGNHVTKLACQRERGFFPDLKQLAPFDLFYFCSPHNPTGIAATHEQLKELIDCVKKHKAILLYDAAYAGFILDPSLPRSIYEIEGAKEVAIEISSFSKIAGFTGVRLGWTIVPSTLHYENGSSMREDWNRLVTTVFNGASCLSQEGGIAALSESGMLELNRVIEYYRINALLLRDSLLECGYEVYGGEQTPYLWVFIKGKSSWELFQHFLDEKGIIATPGSGFGSEGEGYLRFSAFARRDTIEQAIQVLKK